METIGASHSFAAWRHFSSGTMSLRLVEYSRMRPHPVQVRLHVCSGSSCKTIANFGVLRSLCLTIWPAIFADKANGNRIVLNYWAKATSLEITGPAVGALVMGGSALSKPGKKNDAGETVWLALMPPHPVQPTINAAAMASDSKCQFNLTCSL